jgi:surfeit locus 1 family protein
LRFFWITLATVAGIGVTGSLGRWQLHRAAEKEALQASMDTQGVKHYLDAPTLFASPDPTALIHQHAVLRGRWAADQSVYLDNRQMDGKVGFFVLTPLVLEGDKQAIVVQRGWAPRNFVQRDALPAVETPSAWVTVEGRVAPAPSKLFELGSPATTVIRQNLDMEQYRVQTHLPLLSVTLVQTGPSSEGLQRAWPAVNLGVEKHYGYALQWFGMAALLALLYLWFQFLKPLYFRSKDSKPHA